MYWDQSGGKFETIKIPMLRKVRDRKIPVFGKLMTPENPTIVEIVR